MIEKAESRPTREQWKSLGILTSLAGGGVGAQVEGPIGALAGMAAGPILTACVVITIERLRQARRKNR